MTHQTASVKNKPNVLLCPFTCHCFQKSTEAIMSEIVQVGLGFAQDGAQ